MMCMRVWMDKLWIEVFGRGLWKKAKLYKLTGAALKLIKHGMPSATFGHYTNLSRAAHIKSCLM